MARTCLGNSPLGLAHHHQVANIATLSRLARGHKRGVREKTACSTGILDRARFRTSIRVGFAHGHRCQQHCKRYIDTQQATAMTDTSPPADHFRHAYENRPPGKSGICSRLWPPSPIGSKVRSSMPAAAQATAHCSSPRAATTSTGSTSCPEAIAQAKSKAG